MSEKFLRKSFGPESNVIYLEEEEEEDNPARPRYCDSFLVISETRHAGDGSLGNLVFAFREGLEKC